MTEINKFDLMNKVTLSTLASGDKVLLIELILRWNQKTGQLNPSVERLCKARGIKHEKNFKGAEAYLEGLVTKKKSGRNNYYQLNIEAIMCLEELKVTIKHTPMPEWGNTPAVEGVSTTEADSNTPAVEGVNTPASADDTPALADNTPASAADTPSVEGANSSVNTSVDSSVDTSSDKPVDADASPLNSKSNLTQGEITKEEEVVVVDSPLASNSVELPFVSNKSSAPSSDELNSFWNSVLESKEETSAPTDAPSNEESPAREWVDITFEAFEKWLEEASPEEQIVAIYGYDYKKYDSLERIMKTAVESTKPQYDEWTAVATKYAYAEKEVDAPGRDRTKEAEAAEETKPGNTKDYDIDKAW